MASGLFLSGAFLSILSFSVFLTLLLQLCAALCSSVLPLPSFLINAFHLMGSAPRILILTEISISIFRCVCDRHLVVIPLYCFRKTSAEVLSSLSPVSDRCVTMIYISLLLQLVVISLILTEGKLWQSSPHQSHIPIYGSRCALSRSVSHTHTHRDTNTAQPPQQDTVDSRLEHAEQIINGS